MLEIAASSPYCGARILVTGATGFIASSLAAALGRGGAEVHGNARHQPRAALAGVYAFHAADLADAGQCRALIATVKPEIVFHLASHVSGRQDLDTVAQTLSGNLVTSVNLFSALAEAGCARAVVTAGSCEEPRQFAHADPESAPASPYAAAKLAAAAYAGFFRKTLGLPVTHARIFMGYGPGQLDLVKLVPYLTLALLKGETPRLGSGHRLVDFVYIDDIVAGLLALGLHPERPTLDIGSGVLTSIRDLALQLRDIARPGAEIAFGGIVDRRNETSLAADLDQVNATVDWRPKVGLDEGLKRTVAWYRDRLPMLGSGC